LITGEAAGLVPYDGVVDAKNLRRVFFHSESLSRKQGVRGARTTTVFAASMWSAPVSMGGDIAAWCALRGMG